MTPAGLLRYRMEACSDGNATNRLVSSGGPQLAPKLYTSTEAREILRIGKTRMNDMLVSGELPSFKVGQRRRITEDALQAYLVKQQTLIAA
jgi:excisionase family DNA binding protein